MYKYVFVLVSVEGIGSGSFPPRFGCVGGLAKTSKVVQGFDRDGGSRDGGQGELGKEYLDLPVKLDGRAWLEQGVLSRHYHPLGEFVLRPTEQCDEAVLHCQDKGGAKSVVTGTG
jgi:hypothetical protein